MNDWQTDKELAEDTKALFADGCYTDGCRGVDEIARDTLAKMEAC